MKRVLGDSTYQRSFGHPVVRRYHAHPCPFALVLPCEDRLTSRGDLIATQEIKFPGRNLFQAQALDYLEEPA